MSAIYPIRPDCSRMGGPLEPRTYGAWAALGSGATDRDNERIRLAWQRRTRRARKQNPASEAGEKETSQ